MITKITGLLLDNVPFHQANLHRSKTKFTYFSLRAYSQHLNKIKMIWRILKYECLKLHSYVSLENLWEVLNKIFIHFAGKYFINFKD
ncbi:hypothetical protein GXP67_11275 [Rhodocytophaga rosea]|uniref:Uncharacterized protein n=1 Tax=Rhodocytophaga rosea TaxID=2704465 RepID=A0A6C0GVZ4_9BACT|nr:hypothetical protein GXP67_11275 [Rhodocytophaga rosea]